MKLSGDLKRLNHLHREIRREIFSESRNDKRLWDFIERLAAVLLMLREEGERDLPACQIEGRSWRA